jgi:glycine dehydrogenase subunit 1
MSLLGEAGLTKLARLNHARAIRLADALSKVPGVELQNKTFFNEMTVKLNKPAARVVDILAERGILAGVPVSRLDPGHPDVEHLMVLAATELTTDNDIDLLVAGLREVL